MLDAKVFHCSRGGLFEGEWKGTCQYLHSRIISGQSNGTIYNRSQRNVIRKLAHEIVRVSVTAIQICMPGKALHSRSFGNLPLKKNNRFSRHAPGD
jgi:hypothetical protein